MKKYYLYVPLIILMFLSIEPAFAELSNQGILNTVATRFQASAAGWLGAIQGAASRIFWSLATISMVWTFGLLALRKADINEFFTEFVKFTVFTGFFWWLLTNAATGQEIATTIITGLQQLGANAGGLPNAQLGPSSIIDVGFEIVFRTNQIVSELDWTDAAVAITMILLAIGILIVLGLVAINMLLLQISAWLLLYAGVFFLGFGGSRWTSDIAINYFKTVLGIAVQLMVMILLVALGKQFLLDSYATMNTQFTIQELTVMLIIAISLLVLINKVPPMIAGVVSGSGIGAGVGNYGAGTAASAAGVAAAATATAGAALAAGAANIGGGIQALYAAASKANDNVSSGSDILSNFSGSGSKDNGLSYAAAMGHDTGSTGSGSTGSGSTGSGSAGSGSAGSGSAGSGSAAGKAGRVAADTVANLASGAYQTAKSAIGNRIADSAGGKIARSINPEMFSKNDDKKSVGEPLFDGNSISGGSKVEPPEQSEIDAFVNKGSQHDNASNQGAFREDAISEQDTENSRSNRNQA